MNRLLVMDIADPNIVGPNIKEADEGHLNKNERLFFYLNCSIFIFNIIINIRLKNTPIVIAATVALILSIYVYNADYKKNIVWLLDQITLLAILIPGIYSWLHIDIYKYPLAGLLLCTALVLYVYSIFSKALVHDESGEIRSGWHVVLHLITTLGHIMLHYETHII